MKKVLSLLLALIPATAVAADDDPCKERFNFERFDVSARIGYHLGAGVSPNGVMSTETGGGVLVQLEADWVAFERFSFGPYFMYLDMPVTEVSRDAASFGGYGLSGGATVKARFGDKVQWRPTMYIGWNSIVLDIAEDDELIGSGYALGLATDISYAVTDKIALIGKVGFIAQGGGSGAKASELGDVGSLAIPPMWFLAVGGEWRI
jgi:hypothetical protein